MYTMYHILPSKLPNFVHCPVWTALCEKSSNIRINFLNFTLLETNLWAWMNVCECSLPLTAKVDGLTSKQEIDSWMVETVLHSTRGGEIKLNEISSQKWDIHLDIFIFIYSIASTCANGQMLLWMNLFTLVKSASQFFSGCVLRSGSLDIGDTKTCTRTMRRYCQFRDTHNFNLEVLEIQRHSLFTGHCQPGCTFWQVAERGLDGGTICIFQHSLYGMVLHGGLGGTIYKANVGAWRTHNKDGWSEVQHSLIWQCKLLLWLWIEFSPWNN